MALHLNFYHEIQKDAHVRARDPIKLAGLAAAGVALLFLGYYFYRSSEVSEVQRQANAMRSEWQKIEPQVANAEEQEKELIALQKKNKNLVTRLEGRFYWAPLLELIASGTPDVVQLTDLEGKLSNRQVTLMISGLAAGEQPRLVAEQFRAGLEERLEGVYQQSKATFAGSSLEETGRQIEINQKRLSIVRFTVEATFSAKPAQPVEEEAEKEGSTK